MNANKPNQKPNPAISFQVGEEGMMANIKTMWFTISTYLDVLMGAAPPEMTLDELAIEIKNACKQCQAFPMAGLLYARNAGEWLLNARAALPPAAWENWLTTRCHLSVRTAETYMQMAKGWPGFQTEKKELSQRETPAFHFSDFSVEVEEAIAEVEEDEELEEEEIWEETEDLEEGETEELRTQELLLEAASAQPLEVVEAIQPSASHVNSPASQVSVSQPTTPQVEIPEVIEVVATAIPEEEPASNIIKFYIPGYVVPKARPRVTSNGTFLPRRYREWRDLAQFEITRQLSDLDSSIALPIKKAEISLIFFGRHRTNSDLDNLAGACLDALTLHGVGVLQDDRISCVSKLTVEYEPDVGKTGVLIQIEPLD